MCCFRALQDMTKEQNGALQALFEDSMAALTTAVEQLSDKMKVEVAKLHTALATASCGSDDDAAGVRAPARPPTVLGGRVYRLVWPCLTTRSVCASTWARSCCCCCACVHHTAGRC